MNRIRHSIERHDVIMAAAMMSIILLTVVLRWSGVLQQMTAALLIGQASFGLGMVLYFVHKEWKRYE